MTQIATVREKYRNGTAQVFVRRLTACGKDCSKCSGCTQVVVGETLVTAQNGLGANVGDEVMVASQSSRILKAALVVYILPFLFFFVAYFFAQSFLPGVTEQLAVTLGMLGFGGGLGFAMFWDRRERRRRALGFEIIEIRKRCLDM